ncbi:hypothetical protein KGA66_27345 [Actinocrinis puniceicyclus]|uniref:Uncharacterized protein n=1 Tax=Actinocrinis puniceicyclus TaxID=977794 RepID=A0A8J7WVS0_9ACTN|nr:hypothetical protein [Actinocrinis puniceicyclus]MBS2966782.1 hypothetical protein [Actinocrinis puniceicyclus]
MSVQGQWKLLVNTPMGDQRFTAVLHDEDGIVTGTMTNDANGLTAEVFDGHSSGDALEFKMNLKQMRMTLAFAVSVAGDELEGKVKAGMFGKFKVRGERAAA